MLIDSEQPIIILLIIAYYTKRLIRMPPFIGIINTKTMNIFFIIIYAIWFVSEILINRLLRSQVAMIIKTKIKIL